jgi:hypothetical protein
LPVLVFWQVLTSAQGEADSILSGARTEARSILAEAESAAARKRPPPPAPMPIQEVRMASVVESVCFISISPLIQEDGHRGLVSGMQERCMEGRRGRVRVCWDPCGASD